MNRDFLGVGLAFGVAGLLLAGLASSVQPVPQAVLAAPPANVAPQVWEATAGGGEADFLVVLAEQADLSTTAVGCGQPSWSALSAPAREARLRYVYDTLRETALRSQAPLRAQLDAAGVDYQPFYIVNMLAVRSDRSLIMRLAAHPEVARIAANPPVRQALPAPSPYGRWLGRGRSPTRGEAGTEWNVARINADSVWTLGYTGQSIVVAGQDTGYDWDHPALINQYRGYNGIPATHDYNWHDAIHSGGGVCGADSPVPCDDNGHGTHTMGIVVGDNGMDKQIGVAPGARWIGCRNMDNGWGTPATYAECFEFFLAPYPIAGDPFSDGVPSLAPHVINNSWTCPPSEGCEPDTLQAIVENVRAAGIVVVASAGNSGSGCETVQEPPAIYDAAFSVGATDSGDNVAGFSSRGPVTVDGSGRFKPDVTAPGVGVHSSLPGGGYGSLSGTSMAGPHVAGTVALLWSAAPHLIGDVDTTEQIIAQTARPRINASCGSEPGGRPNNVYGWGIVDALAAVGRTLPELEVTKQVYPSLVQAGAQLTYTLRVTNTGDVTLTATITDILPDYVTPAGVLTWTPSITAAGGVWMEPVVVTVEVDCAGPLTNVVQVTTDQGTAGVYTHTLAPDLDVAVQARPDPVQASKQLTYTILVTNTGDFALRAIVTDALPAHATPTGTLTWTATITAPGSVWTETVVVTVETDYVGPLTNVVRVTTDQGATGVYTTTSLSLMPQVEVTKKAVSDLIQAGSQLTYTIDVSNTSCFALTQVILTDVVPMSTTFAWASGNYTRAGSVVTWTAASLAGQETLTATLVVMVEHLPPGTRVVNGAYGVYASELLTPVVGMPVEVTVPWRYILSLVFKNWLPGGNSSD